MTATVLPSQETTLEWMNSNSSSGAGPLMWVCGSPLAVVASPGFEMSQI